MLYLAIPALNEADTIGVLLWRLRSVLAEFPREYEVVVYDDASSDVTSEVLEPYTKVLPLTVLRGERTVGYAGAIDALVRYVSRQTRYPRRDAMLLLQGDFTDPPALVPEFAKRFEGGADMVIGERSQSADTPVSVRRLLRVTPWVTRPFVRVQGVRDITSSFRLIRISVLRDLIRAAGDAPVCVGDELTANADFLLRTVPLARRVETVPVEPTFGVRTRETRRITMRDGIALARWAWRARGRRVAPSTAPESPADNARSQRGDSKNDSRNDSRTDPRADVRTDARTEVRVEAKHEPRLETRTSSRGEARPNPRNDARREARRDARNEVRKKERPEPRAEIPREYGNDQLYDLNAESRSAAATGALDATDAIAADTPSSSEERRPKRPRPKRRKRGQRKTLDADGNPTAIGSDSADATESVEQADGDASEHLSANSGEQDSDGNVAELSEVDRAKRSSRKKRRKRGSRRNRSADGLSAEAGDAPGDGAEPSTRSSDASDNDSGNSGDSDYEDSPRGDDDNADNAGASDGTDAPRARRRGRRGRRGGARRSRSAAADGSSSNEGGGDENRPSQNGSEPAGDSAST